jgi:tocopherol O-methyltransferase
VASTSPDIVAYYESKTRAVLERYGPGPRVHYHVGLVDSEDLLNIPAERLREKLVASQERMLRHAAEVWRVRYIPFEDVLDVGCGLGGGAIFWAQEFGAHVTAVTIAPSHVAYVVAIDSSSSFTRWAWFRRLAELLRPGGRVFVADCFLGQTGYQDTFNRHWRAQIGTIGEYIAAADAAGMRCDLTDDISARTVQFWSMTIEMLQCEIATEKLGNPQLLKIKESIAVHEILRRGLVEGGFRYALMSFSKPKANP